MFNSEHCSPSKKKNKYSCIRPVLLRKIAKILNKHTNSKIKLNSKKQKLHSDISKAIQEISKCKHEKCWITIQILKNELSEKDLRLFEKNFRPTIPKEWINNPNTWLSTTDINNVLTQYEIGYPQFKYLGAHPINFDTKLGDECVSNELCNIDIQELKKDKKTSIGIVLNTDPHHKSGKHWFSIYIDLKGVNRKAIPCIYYFDSVVGEPQKEVKDFIERIKSQYKEMNRDIDVLYNDIEHQKGNTECGVYCLHFLVSMLKGESFEKYINTRKNDKEMERFRNIFYTPLKDTFN